MLKTGGFWETPGIDNLEYRVMNSKENSPQSQDERQGQTPKGLFKMPFRKKGWLVAVISKYIGEKFHLIKKSSLAYNHSEYKNYIYIFTTHHFSFCYSVGILNL